MDRSFVDRYEADADLLSRLVSDLSPSDLAARPGPGAWSIAECVVHLTDCEAVFADRMKRIIAEESPLLLAFDENRWTDGLAYAKRDAVAEAALFAGLRRQMATILTHCSENAWQRVGNHSIAGSMTLAAVVEKANRHLHHHVTFIQVKRQALGKPVIAVTDLPA